MRGVNLVVRNLALARRILQPIPRTATKTEANDGEPGQSTDPRIKRIPVTRGHNREPHYHEIAQALGQKPVRLQPSAIGEHDVGRKSRSSPALESPFPARQRRAGQVEGRPEVFRKELVLYKTFRVHLETLVPPGDRLRAELEILSCWRKLRAIAWAVLDKSPARVNPPPEYMQQEHSSPADRAFVELIQAENVAEMKKIWEAVKLERGDDPVFWNAVMANALLLAPGRAHEVLEATFEEIPSRFYVASDCLPFFLDQLNQLPPHEQGPYRKALFRLVLHLLNNTSPGYLRFPRNTLYHISKLPNNAEGLFEIYSALTDHYQFPLNGFTKLQFASRFAANPQYKKTAVAILGELVRDHKINPLSQHVAALVTAILSFSKKEALDASFNSLRADLFEALLDIGIRPNLINFTAMIRILCLSGDMTNAWRVFDTMRERGIQPDAQLMGTLLNGLRHAEDYDSMARLLPTLSQDGLKHPIIFNELISTIYSAGSKQKEIPPFPFMLQAFSKFYDIKPLQRLLPTHNLQELMANTRNLAETARRAHSEWLIDLAPLITELDELAPPTPLKPTRDIITLMLMGYIKSVSQAYHVVAFYSTFHQLLKGDDKLATDIVSHGTLIHDLVIEALIQWPDMLRVSLDIVQDMLSDPNPPRPSLHTYSILIKAFGAAARPEEAERILDIMRDHGIEPTRAVWNTSVWGYALQQNVPAVASVMVRAEQAGLQPDEFTVRAFSHVHDTEGVLEAMREMVQVRREKGDDRKDVGEEMRELAGQVGEVAVGMMGDLAGIEEVVEKGGPEGGGAKAPAVDMSAWENALEEYMADEGGKEA
ncbi:hypothetical protein QBC47DRAFT_221009 [Echria macrotheca]|uniref:Pentatricopeptide repeat protein n=1 Tax=Echria macrotheca TaxID=438768 RepID=A0AAJ0BA89_9PEZI|nr:hypothetical protein QBC47DRAFT_221009 [Echria macrotheca]